MYLIFVLLERHHIGDAAAGEEAQCEGHHGQPGRGSCGAPAPKAARAAGGGFVATTVSAYGVVACCIKNMAVAFKSLFKAPLFYCTNGHNALLG